LFLEGQWRHYRSMPPWSLSLEDVLKLVLAILIGGAIGAEREYRDRAAGFRTLIFICVGAALFTMFSLTIGITRDQARIAAGVVSGVGFLGGGVILREGGSVMGLTTAAVIWLTAALGMGIGAGYFGFTLVAAGAVLVVLWLFPLVERWIDDLRVTRTYRLVVPVSAGVRYIDELFQRSELRIHAVRHGRRVGELTVSFGATGSIAAHQALVDVLLADETLHELSY
jgi:putative Mg2+ transporter-C (MgtC) family protein